MINKHIGIVGIKTNYSTKETGFFLKGGAHAHVAPPWLRPCVAMEKVVLIFLHQSSYGQILLRTSNDF